MTYAVTAIGTTAERSVFVPAKPRVSLGTPIAPKTMKQSKSYTVYGSLKPRHTKGTKPVRIYKYKKVGQKWVKKGYVKATAYNYNSYTRYKVKMKLTSKGSWRLRAYAPADSRHSATWSKKYDYVKVKWSTRRGNRDGASSGGAGVISNSQKGRLARRPFLIAA